VKFIGDRLLRKEDPRLVQGRGRYVATSAAGMLHAPSSVAARPCAHGAIDLSRALKAPGVVGVVTFADLGEAARPLPIVRRMRRFAGRTSICSPRTGRASSRGRGRVVAESRYAAEDAALIDVAWEPCLR